MVKVLGVSTTTPHKLYVIVFRPREVIGIVIIVINILNLIMIITRTILHLNRITTSNIFHQPVRLPLAAYDTGARASGTTYENKQRSDCNNN